jgi:NAD(P)-dependent dehydrogenase (short-subunit alcohol dehydrogenase family)
MSKTVFITGASRGLGKGFVDYLLSTQHQVFAGVRTIPGDDPTPNLHYITLDVTSDDSIANAVIEVQKHTQGLDILINNAGVNKDSATGGQKEEVCNLPSLRRDKLLEMYNINAVSPIIVVKHFLPLLTANPSFVINVSSDRASFHDEFENPNANYGYRASKIALNMMTYASLTDLPKNVKTFAVHPGNMKTDMNPDGTDDPHVQAEKIIGITTAWNDAQNGKFLRFDGTPYTL